MESTHRRTVLGLIIAFCLVPLALAQTHKEFRFTVGPKANVSVDSQAGAISVKPGSPNQVIVNAVLQSDKVEVDNSQKGNRVEIESHLLAGGNDRNGRVDYELTVPPDATVTVQSPTGPLTAERLQGDLSFEGAAAPIEVRSVSHGHVHIKTINGTISMNDVHSAHIEITSISGDVRLNQVSGPLVQVNSGSGRIYYDGDFGAGGDYTFVTNSGDIEALVPADASADFTARSMKGQVENDFPLQPKPHTRLTVETGRSFVGTVGKAASQVVLRSFSGKIRLKQR